MEAVDIHKLTMDQKMNLLLENMVMKSDLNAWKESLSTEMKGISTQLNNKLDAVQGQVDGLVADRALDRETLTTTTDEVTELKQEVNEMKKYIKQSKIRERNHDVHSRRFNLIVGNLLDDGSWESQSLSMSKVRTFLRQLHSLEIEEDQADNWNPDAIVIKEAHRLPQDPNKLRSSAPGSTRSKNRLMIVKFECMTDISIILSKCKLLKTINEGKPTHKRLFVDRHYPKAVQEQKQALKDAFIKLKAEGKKPSYKYDISTATMRLICKD